MQKNIQVVPYNPQWPIFFQIEAAKIRQALEKNCVAVHHVGSTSVPGLSAKPKLDILVVVKSLDTTQESLTSIGYQYRGEYNIPLHGGFSKRGELDINLHVYEEGHPEIELNLLFRDYLRRHPETKEEYAKLKQLLLQNNTSFEKVNPLFTGYNLGKDEFIRKVLKNAGFNRIRLMTCTHYAEWEAAKQFRQKYFFDRVPIADPYTWTFDHPEHSHLVLYHGVNIVGYTHIQFWPNQRAAIRIIVIDEMQQSKGYGSYFLRLCEQWLKRQGIKTLHVESRPDAQAYYNKNKYVEMPFNDPQDEATHSDDIAMGKNLENSEPLRKVTRMGVYGVAMREDNLLVIRQKHGPFAGKFDFPGGGIEFGESPEEALYREFGEEVGMTFDSLSLIDTITSTTDVLGKGCYTFYQIGLIYQVDGCKQIHETLHGELPYEWVDIKTVTENQCSKLLWKYLHDKRN